MVDFSAAFFAYYLALTVIVTALVLSYINNTNLFSRNVRQIITDYALVIAVLFAIALSYSTNSVEVFLT